MEITVFVWKKCKVDCALTNLEKYDNILFIKKTVNSVMNLKFNLHI